MGANHSSTEPAPRRVRTILTSTLTPLFAATVVAALLVCPKSSPATDGADPAPRYHDTVTAPALALAPCPEVPDTPDGPAGSDGPCGTATVTVHDGSEPGTSVDTDRHDGIHETLDASGKKWDVIEVAGKWDDPTAQKVTADAIATNGPFVGITGQGGDTGIVQAMIDAKHPMVPFGGETENGFRKFCAKFAADGLKCSSAGTGPAQVAVAIKTAIAALEGNVVPQAVKLPLAVASDPDMKEGQDYFPDQSDNFFVGNSFPTCGINFTAQEIMGQTKENQ